MSDIKENLNTPIARLPRAAARATHVWETHRDKDPSLDTHGAALAEAIERFNLGLAALTLREGKLAEARLQLADTIRALLRSKRGCLAEATLALADFDSSGMIHSEVPEDAIAEARTVHGRVEARLDEGDAIPHAARHLESLAAAIAATEKAVAAVYAADSAAQATRDERHAAAARLDDRLIAFRRVVRSVLGSTHRDYRKLRARAARGEAEVLDDETVTETETATATDTTTGTENASLADDAA